MYKYKGYWIASSPLPGMRTTDGWQPSGVVCVVEASKRTIEIVRFECSRTFADKVAALDHGLEVARQWVDEKGESFRQSGKCSIGRTPCPCDPVCDKGE